jgi:hypothetical protein
MKYKALPVILMLPAVAAAGDLDPPIKITINPEARVSAALAGALPPSTICGRPVEFRVWIVNQGFVTSRLEARLVGEVPAGTVLDFHPEPLKGVPEEQRTLRLTLTAPGPTDITISFRSQNNAPDLGGRDKVHFLMKCFSES